jgi:hypothetical protein
MAGDLSDRVTLTPLRLFVLGAVAEGAPREGAVLVEVPVRVGLDHRRSFARTHVCQRLLHGEVDRQRIHAVDLPARYAEPEAAR